MQNKKRAKGTHQADNLAKLRQEFLSMPVLIAQILCAVEVKKSSVALGVAYTYATPLPLRRFFYLPLQRFFYRFIATSHAPQMTVRKLPTFALSPTT